MQLYTHVVWKLIKPIIKLYYKHVPIIIIDIHVIKVVDKYKVIAPFNYFQLQVGAFSKR